MATLKEEEAELTGAGVGAPPAPVVVEGLGLDDAEGDYEMDFPISLDALHSINEDLERGNFEALAELGGVEVRLRLHVSVKRRDGARGEDVRVCILSS